MGIDFKATIGSSYPLRDQRVLLLETDFEGSIEAGDWIEMDLPSRRATRVQVKSIGWGSAFQAHAAKLMLIVTGLPEAPADGTELRGASPPDR